MLACRLAVLPRGGPDPLRLEPGLLGWLGVALALLTLASFGILVSRTLELNGGAWDTLFPDMRLALTVTHFGHVWWWRVPALAVSWLGWAWCTRRPGRTAAAWAMALVVAAIALTRSETGHPADHGDFILGVWVDWLHILAAGAWVGSLFGMSLAVFPRLLRAGSAALASSLDTFQRLSTLSGAALAVLVACGIYNAVTQLDGFAGLWTTRYGTTLDVKLAIVLTMIVIGAHNHFIKLPRLRRAASDAGGGTSTAPGASHAAAPGIVRACARAVLLEALLGLAVIGATAALIHSMPPADIRDTDMPHPTSASGPDLPAIGPVVAAAAHR